MEMLTALDDLEAAWDKLASVPVTTLGAGQVLAVLDRLETQRRRQPAIEHVLLNQLQAQATAKDMGAKSWRAVLAQRLGISGPDAGRRLAEAAVLGPRRALTGEPLEPHLPATATAQARGEIGTDHVRSSATSSTTYRPMSTWAPGRPPKPNSAGSPAG